MRKANATIWKLSSPVVRFDDMTEKIFLHEGTLILFHSEYHDVDEDPDGTILYAHENGEILNLPIDEYGETHSEVGHCPIIGRAGDTVSPYHEVIMGYIKAQDPESIPGNYERIRKILERYRIGISDEERGRRNGTPFCSLPQSAAAYCSRAIGYPCTALGIPYPDPNAQ